MAGRPRPKPAPSGESPQSVSSLQREFALLRQNLEHQNKLHTEHIEHVEEMLKEDRRSVGEQFKSIAEQFKTINEHLAQLVKTVRVENIEKKVTDLERRNDRLDGAALAAKIIWFIVGGVIAGLIVGWLK